MAVIQLDNILALGEAAPQNPLPRVDWEAISTKSTNSTAGCAFHHPAIYPENSIIEDYFQHATNYLEGADCYVVGSIIPVIAATLGRAVWFDPWTGRLYPNVFVMLAGKAADRKTTTIKYSYDLARRVIDPISFLPASFSPESLFDAYDHTCGGCPDKILIADEANTILSDWRQTGNGERNASRFLKLYDCSGDSESFKRNIPRGANRQDINNGAMRVIDETSTSVLFGATYQVAFFQGQSVRAGIERRFLYYIGTRHARLITLPIARDEDQFQLLADAFRCLHQLQGAVSLSPDAIELWNEIQISNRRELDDLPVVEEAKASRLGTVPTHILKIAMNFQAARWAKVGGTWQYIDREILECSQRHVAACMASNDHGSVIGNRAALQRDADSILSRIRSQISSKDGSHIATKSKLTHMFCSNPNREGSMQPDTLYKEIIPLLVQGGQAYVFPRQSDRSAQYFAFRAEEM